VHGLRAANPSAASVQRMGVDHRRADIPMTQQLLDSADVIAIFEEMCSKGMANLNDNRGWGVARLAVKFGCQSRSAMKWTTPCSACSVPVTPRRVAVLARVA